MNIDNLIKEIIPPADYVHRNGFNNIPLIDKLTEFEKQLLEKALIEKLVTEITNKFPDTLIVETLAYLKSIDSLPILKRLLNNIEDPIIKLRIATSVFEINKDSEMIDMAINSAKQLDDKKKPYYIYDLSGAFYYLAKFNNAKVNSFIETYTNHKEYLISYNAKRTLTNN